MTSQNYTFDKPVIILAAPRSGSTLLYEVLSKAKNVWSIGNESHGVFENIAKFNPCTKQCNSNRLIANDADDESSKIIRSTFYNNLINRDGITFNNLDTTPRFIEKTPKNALRIPFLNKIFPDAYYIFLYRNPIENVSSIMDGWQSQRFVTYPKLIGRSSSWSFLLPPGWERMHNKPLEEIAYFQWKSANTYILNDLESLIPKDRWMSISYSNVISDTESTIKKLCDFCKLEFDSILQETCQKNLSMSRYTLSAPSPTKWHKNVNALRRVIPSSKHIIKKLEQIAWRSIDSDFNIHIPDDIASDHTDEEHAENQFNNIGRNLPCPCGSGKKFKRCHGKV